MWIQPLLTSLILIVSSTVVFADSQPKQTREQQLAELHWRHGAVHLDASRATVTQPAPMVMVTGAEARKFEELTNGSSSGDMEAVSVDAPTKDVVYFQYTNSGYVQVDDWTTLNPDDMLQSINDNTEQGNQQREERGIVPVHVVGWLERPTYDKATNTVRWAIAASSPGEPPSFNAVALRLGRRGYQQLTWAGEQSKYRGRGGLLDAVIHADQFDKGSRYQDFVSGDEIAKYGITALVGTVAGATLAKTGVFVSLLLLLKKFLLLLVVAAGGAWRWVQKRLSSFTSRLKGEI